MGGLTLPDVVTVLAVAAGGIADVRTGRIFNSITYPAIVVGLIANGLGLGVGLADAVVGFLVALIPFYLLFSVGWMGGGDVKLMAAIGALKGFPFVLHAMFYAIFMGGVAAALLLIWRGQIGATLRQLVKLLRQLAISLVLPGSSVVEPVAPLGGSLPFGVAICFGTLVAMALQALPPGGLSDALPR